jgi:two-component system phosphate regulon sensor histidine kinase PhoR
MRKSTVMLIIAGVGVALIALVGVQIYWAASAYRLSEKEFTSKVKDAMVKTTEEMNKEVTCFELFSKTRINAQEGFFIGKKHFKNDVFLPNENPDTVPMFFADANDRLPFKWDNLMFSNPVDVKMVLTFNYLETDSGIPVTPGSKIEQVTLQNYRDAFSEHKPIEKIFPPELTDSLLRKNLAAAWITDSFNYGFVRSDLNRIDYSSSKNSKALLASPFGVPLTNSTYFSQPYELRIAFHNYSQMILAGIKRLLIASVLVIATLLIAFFLFARIILKQRKLSELKNDFINNMTHEFKTPLTNISLALENLAANKSVHDSSEEKVLKIIGHETGRLRENVDRILQVARFEKETLHLSLEETDVHQLIQKTVTAFEPVINCNGTTIQCDLKAENPLVKADETLLFNAIYNVIDNGISYNAGKPVITITTGSQRNGVFIKIKDNGIGISAAHQKKIFENFYRVPQGNLHDVKGYGLGLSYVKLIVNAHSGEVEVNSQPGQGSEFKIFIPVI